MRGAAAALVTPGPNGAGAQGMSAFARTAASCKQYAYDTLMMTVMMIDNVASLLYLEEKKTWHEVQGRGRERKTALPWERTGAQNSRFLGRPITQNTII